MGCTETLSSVQFCKKAYRDNNFWAMDSGRNNTLANASDYSADMDLTDWEKILEVTMTNEIHLRMSYTVVMTLIFVTGVCGNLLTCVVIYSNKSMHTTTNYYLFNLAVSDLLGAFGILIEVAGYTNYPYALKGFGDIVCKAYFFMVGVLWNNSVLIITALAIERFIAIWYPLLLNKKQAWRRVMKIICFIWVLAILETVPEIFTVFLVKKSKISICFIVPTPFSKMLNGILGVVTFIIPLGIMILMYTLVAFKVNTTETRYSYDRNQIFNHRNNNSKVNKLIMALTVSFVVCWLPFFALRIVIFMMDEKPLKRFFWFLQNWEILLMVSGFNSWFSVALNPLLFSLMSTKFRNALKVLWYTKCKRQKPKQRNMIV